MISATSAAEIERLERALLDRGAMLGCEIEAVYGRLRQVSPRGTDGMRCLKAGGMQEEKTHEASEWGVRYKLDFSGYSVGFFLDQRNNRRFLAERKPERVLNLFAYTGSFSVVAALKGAETWSIDLSRKALDWAKENFRLNGLDPSEHHFYVDDVVACLPRLKRRGMQFDAIILDPPTFAHGAGGRLLRAEVMYRKLIELAKPLLVEGGAMLLSTNATRVNVETLKKWAKDVWRAALYFHEESPPEDVEGSPHAVTVWCLV